MTLEEIEKKIQNIPLKIVDEATNNIDRLIEIKKILLESTVLDIDNYTPPSRNRSLELCAKYNQARAGLITYLLNYQEEVDWPKFIKKVPAKIHSKQAIKIFRKVPQTILRDFESIVENFISPMLVRTNENFFTPINTDLGYFSAIEILVLYSQEFFLTILYYCKFSRSLETYLPKYSFIKVTNETLLGNLNEYINDIDLEDMNKIRFIQTYLLSKENLTLLKNNNLSRFNMLKTTLNEKFKDIIKNSKI